MAESKMQDITKIDKSKWVIIDGIPPLRENQDYATFANSFTEAAKMVSDRGSKKEAIVYIPYTKKSSRHSEDLFIDGSAIIAFGTENDANMFRKNYRKIKYLEKFGDLLKVYTCRDIDKLEQLPDKYPKLTREEFQDDRNLLWWLLDEGSESFRDQYVIRYNGEEFEETNVFWMDENQVKTGRELCYDATELKEERKSMTEQYVQWSPNGYYLLTTHPKGVQLWGGPKWQSLQKLEHSHVEQMSFSPNETFLITCNAPYKDRDGQKHQPTCKIWDVLTGDLIIQVPFKTIGPAIKLKLPGWWPIFKWSHDEQYIAKINSSKGMGAKPKDIDKINIFKVVEKSDDELKSENDDDDTIRFKIEKLGGKSLSVNSLFNMEFSPTDNVLAYTSFAQNDDQAKVTLISIPSKNSLKVQTLGFDVKKCHLYWQSQGRYLAINMAHSRGKSNILIKSHSIGIMTVKDKNMPFSRTDTTFQDQKLGKVINFAWEPDGSRYAVIHGGLKKREEPNVSIFQVQEMGGVDQGVSKLKLFLEKRRVNELYWAPNQIKGSGRLVIVNIDPQRRVGGEMEFIDLSKCKNGVTDDSSTVKNLIHETMTQIEWDPSGRYLITATTQNLRTTSGDDTRYIVWSYQGEKLFQHKIKYFYQILWRPRPKKLTKINNSERQKIKHRVDHQWKEMFAKHDEKIRMTTVSEKLSQNRDKLEKYQQRMKLLQSQSRDILIKREELRGGGSSHYTTKTIQQRLEKDKKEYIISKETMRKILNDAEDVIDFNKWLQQQ